MVGFFSPARSRSRIVAICVLAVLAASACRSTPADTDSKTVSGTVPEPSSAALAETVSRAFLGPVETSTLDPVTLAALKTAAVPLTSEQDELLRECLTQTSCETGRGTLTVAIADSNGNNPFRRVMRAEGTAHAIASPDVSKVVYLDAHGDLVTFLSNFRSLISQRVDIITGIFDFASSMGPLVEQAAQAGIAVVPFSIPIPDATAPDEIVTTITADVCNQFRGVGEKIIADLGPTGGLAQITGPAGNAYAATWQPCLQEGLSGSSWQVVFEGNTDWTPQGAQQVTSALLASGQEVDAIVYDYSPEAIIQGYLDSGENPPAIYAGSADGAFLSLYTQAAATGRSFPAYAPQGQTWFIRVAITAGILKFAGQSVPTTIVEPTPIFSLESIAKLELGDLPADTPLLPLLTGQQISYTLAGSGQ